MMPLHCFRRRDNGQLVERFFHATETVPDVLTQGNDDASYKDRLPKGVKADREMVCGKRPAARGKWPIHSRALAFGPGRVTEAIRAEAGCDFDRDGCPVLESPAHRRKVLKRMGAVDQDAYY